MLLYLVRLLLIQLLSLFCNVLVSMAHLQIGLLSFFYYLLLVFFFFLAFMSCVIFSFKVHCFFLICYPFLPSPIICSFFYFAFSSVALLILRNASVSMALLIPWDLFISVALLVLWNVFISAAQLSSSLFSFRLLLWVSLLLLGLFFFSLPTSSKKSQLVRAEIDVLLVWIAWSWLGLLRLILNLFTSFPNLYDQL